MKTKYMMATKALHQLGDVSRELDICYVKDEDDENYIGQWVTGYGFINIKFPKETTRDLTEEEIEKYNKTHIGHSSGHSYKLKVD